MNTKFFKYIIPALSLVFSVNFTSCLGDLDVTPIDPNLNVEFDQNANFAKIYAGLAITGNKGPDGQGDIADTDEGASGLMRMLFNLNELPTDEAICAWSGDVDVYPLNFAKFTASNGVVLNMFNRLYIQIAQCNNFLIQTEGKDDEESLTQRAEVRFIRALDYYYLIDLYGNVPFVDENTGIGTYVPERITRANLYTYIEKVLPICYDGVQTRSWSGLFFIASFISGDMNALVDFGTKEAWGGNRARMALVKKFASDGDLSKTTDTRASFWTTDRTFEINKPTEFTEGYSVTKFKNITKSGQIGHDPNQQFPDMDFPLFRLAEANLTFAEATIRAGGDKQAALSAINQLRKRAKATEITATDLTLDFVLDEKAREFYFEAQRRTDLIRYNKFTSNYTWDWKGETAGGTSISSHFSLLPIPSTQLVANSNLKQNPGY